MSAASPVERRGGRRLPAVAVGGAVALATALALRGVGLLNLSFLVEGGPERWVGLVGEVLLPLAFVAALAVVSERVLRAHGPRGVGAVGAGLAAAGSLGVLLALAGLFDTGGIDSGEAALRLVPLVLVPLVMTAAAFGLGVRLAMASRAEERAEKTAERRGERYGRDGLERRGGLDRRELALVVVAGVVLAVLVHWPVALHMTGTVPGELDDPILQSWHLAWGGNALTEQPLDLFQANTHWPERNSLAFSDGMIGYAPFGLLVGSAGAALVEYNALFLFSFALAFAGAYLLARELGAGRVGAVVAGVAFAYAPWRLAQANHLNVLSSGGIPLALFLLARGYRLRGPATVVAGWLVAAWQLSLGFALGLQFGYLLGVLAVVALVLWIRGGRPALGRRLGAATALGAGAFLSAGALLAGPYLEVAADHPEGRRTLEQVAELSPPPEGYLVSSGGSLVWGEPTKAGRESLAAPGEQSLFPGATIVLLALAGLAVGTYARGLRMGLALGVLVCAALSLGLSVGDGRLTYRPLYELAPGWQGVRTPGRLTTLTSLGLALLAGAGAGWAARHAREGTGEARPTATPVLLAVVLAGAVLLEGWGPGHPGHSVPPAPAGQLAAPAPQLHLPIDGTANHLYTFWSIAGYPRVVNGGGSPPPHALDALKVQAAREFPSRATVAALRRAGVRSVVLHPDLAAGTGAAAVGRRSVRGLGVARRAEGGVVVFDLRGPGGASS